MPDWDNTDSRERDEDAAWRDLVARFDAPLTEQQPVPWPDCEDMSSEPARETGGDSGAAGRHGRPGTDGIHDPEVLQVPRRIRGPVARGVPSAGTPADDEEHFIPPAPPPLPKLDPVAKGAWLALFGGPGYLIVATAAGWAVSGPAAFCAVAAFVAGFAILVLRMHEPDPGGPDDGNDGAVV